MNRFTPYILATALAFPPLAFANHDGSGEHCNMHKHKLFEEADKDKDGTLDREEAKAMHDKHFDEMDTDHDGTLSKEEMAACKHDDKHNAKHDKGSKGFMKADKDNDGTLDREEAKTLPRVSKNFDAIDTDHDGTLSRDEVHEFMKSNKNKK